MNTTQCNSDNSILEITNDRKTSAVLGQEDLFSHLQL